MKVVHIALIVLQLSTLTFLTACAGKTKPYIPGQAEPLADGLARIILTRENQLAGAGSPFEVVDIGDNVKPNSMVACLLLGNLELQQSRFMPVKELSKPKYDTFVSTGLLWTNPDLVTSVYCGNADRQCGTELRDQLAKQEGFLRGDVGLMESNEYYALRLTGHTKSNTRPAGLLTGDMHAISNRPILSKNPPPVIDPDISLLEKIRRQVFETVEIPTHNTFSFERYKDFQGLNIPESKLPLVFHTSIRYKGLAKYNALGELEIPFPAVQKSITLIDNRFVDYIVQLIGRVRTGDTLIWDRNPGTLRLGAVWHDGIDFMDEDVKIEPGKHYYIHYTTKMPPANRWELSKVE